MGSQIGQFVADLSLPLSKTRLDSYRDPANPTDDLAMLTNYFWDIDLAEALVPSLHAVELAVRNSIHSTLCDAYGTDMWFYTPGLLRAPQLEMLAGGLEKLSLKKKKKTDATPDRIVGALTFGFRVSLLTGPYEQVLWQPNGFRNLSTAFPHASAPSRKQIHTHLNDIRELRNRVFHHEDIWKRPRLDHEHANIHQAITWISPTLHDAIHAVDDFPRVFSSRADVQARLKHHLRIP